MRTLAILALFTLAACGADGAPERPGAAQTEVGITGTVEVGVTGGNR